MLTSIQLREENNNTLLTLPLGVPSPSTNLFIKNVEGLGPVPATLSTTSFASFDGEIFQNARVGARNIVLNLGISPRFGEDADVATTRDLIYSYMPPKKNVYLVFIFDNFLTYSARSKTVNIRGYVESVEPSMFSKSSDIQVSIMCPSPYFKKYGGLTINGKTKEYLDTSSFGTAPAGFVFDMTLVTSASKVTLETEFGPPLVYEGSLEVGDRLRISTNSGNKYALLTRAGETSSISVLDNIISGPMNMTLDRRTTSFIVNKELGGGTPYTLYYTPEYVGL